MFLFQLFGLALMAISVINMRERKTKPEHSALSRGVLSFLLTLGLGLMVTAVLGCVGALRENIKILYVVSFRKLLRSLSLTMSLYHSCIESVDDQ